MMSYFNYISIVLERKTKDLIPTLLAVGFFRVEA